MKLLFMLVLSSLLAISAATAETIVGQSDVYLLRTPSLEGDQFRPREDVEAWSVRLPIAWDADPFQDGNWRFQLNAWRMTDPLLLAYFAGNDPRHIHQALAFVEDWHRYHLVEERDHEFAWYDMATGIRALRLAFFIDAARNGLFDATKEQMRILIELADEHARQLQVEEFIAINNHGLFQVAGLNLLCTVLPDRKACTHGQDFAERMFRKIMDSQFTSEGIHTENSPAYHLFVRNLLKSVAALQRLSDGGRMDKIERVRPWLVFPDGNLSRAGDSSSTSTPLENDPDDPQCLPDGGCFAVGDFTGSGYAIVRSLPSERQTSMLFVTGMAHTLTHKHVDELSFELFEFGRFIFIDAGKYGYKRSKMRAYVLSGEAHNTISLAEKHLRTKNVALSGSLLDPIQVTGEGFRISGAVERPALFQQRREIVYSPGRELRITDFLSAPRERQYVSSLHLAPDLVPEVDERGFTVDVGEHDVRAELQSDNCTIETARGKNNPLLGWQSVGYLEMTPASVVRAICPAKDRTISWKITFH